MLLKDRVALITGAGNPQGIGFAVARMYASQGARVALVDLDQAAVSAAAAALGDLAVGIAADVRSPEACALAVHQVCTRWGGLDVLLNSAGVVQSRRTLEITGEDYDFVLDVNLRGTLQMSQAAIPVLRPRASIICIASISGQRGAGLMGGPHYAASKGAVLALMKSMARELGPAGIRVNAVNPGVISTSMNATAFDEEMTNRITGSIPLGRFGQPDDVAGACLYLASDLSSYVTGASLDVNGGMHIY
ncbi:SDR family NAD(P)-dependent oxidoreductase [Variovorax sp. M-6]|uniref:SDR family NAD(P)-dependent oxidoreductase n=1 Tax=Variovorax sp. M-6 TaxID=3233041 RepID=UPI003F9DEE1B